MKKILSWLIVIAMLVAMMPAVFAAEETAPTYTKITSMDELTSGEYVIVCSNGVAMGQLDGSWVLTAAPTIDGDVVTDAAGAVWTLTVDGTNVKLADANGKYIAPKGGNNNGIKEGEYDWTVSCVDGMFAFAGQGSDTVTLAGNADSENKFRGYKNTTVTGQYASKYPSTFALYKLTEAEEPVEVENPMVLGTNEFEVVRGSGVPCVMNFVATQTGTLYVNVNNLRYLSQYSTEYESTEYLEDFVYDTTFDINGQTLEKGTYGTIEVVEGEVYTFTWTLSEDSYYSYKADVILSYSDEIMPVPGIDIDLVPADLPRDTVEIAAGGEQTYLLSTAFEGYILCVHGENAYITFQTYDYSIWDFKTVTIEAVDGVVEYDFSAYYCYEINIGNAGAEAATFELTCNAPEGGVANPIIVETLDEINVSAVEGEYITTFFQWTATETGTVTVLPDGTVDIYFYNETKEENGEYDATWTYYSFYAEVGDVVQIQIGSGNATLDYWFEYEFEAGYRVGSVLNPAEVDLIAGLDTDGMNNETIYYTWTPDFTGTVAINFTYLYSWTDAKATMMIGETEFAYGVIDTTGAVLSESAELAVTAGVPVEFHLIAASRSVYGNLVATILTQEEEEPTEQTVTLADMDVDVPQHWLGVTFTYEAPADGTATIVIAEPDAGTAVEYGFRSNEENGNYFLTNRDGLTQTIEVKAGETIRVALCMQVLNEDGSNGAYIAGNTHFTLTFTGILPEGWEPPVEEEPEDPATTALVVGDNTLSIEAGVADSPSYTFTATEAGTLVLTIDALQYTAADGTYTWDLAEGFPLTLTVNGEMLEVATTELTVAAGDVVTVQLTQNRMYVNGGYAWEANLNIAYAVPEGGALVLGDNTIEQDLEYTFTAEEAGTLIVKLTQIVDNSGWTDSGNSLGNFYGLKINGQDVTNPRNTYDVEVGDTITVSLYSIDGYVYTGTVNLSYAAASLPIGLGFNDLAVYQGYYYVAEQTGTLYVTITELFNNAWGESMYEGADEYYIAFGYIAVMVNGVQMTSFNHSLEVNEGDEISIVVNTTYDVTTTLHLSFEGHYEHPLGSEKNPIYLTYADCPTTTVEIPAGEAYWYKLDYDFAHATLTVKGEGAYILIDQWGTEVRIDAVDGVVSYPVGTYYIYDIQIGNAGETAATFDIEAYIPLGSSSNPDTLVEGDNSCEVEAYDWYHWTWTAPEDGLVTFTFTTEDWYADMHINGNWTKSMQAQNGDDPAQQVQVSAGDVIQLQVRLYANYSSYAGTVGIHVAFESGGVLVEPEYELILGTNNIGLDKLYTYTATEDGTLTLSFELFYGSNGGVHTGNLGSWVDVLIDGEPITVFENTIEVLAGQKVTVRMVSRDGDTSYYGTVTVSFAAAGGEVAVGTQANPDTLIIGEQIANVPVGYEGYNYVWTAEEAGELTVTVVGEFYVFYLANQTTGENYYYAQVMEQPDNATLTVNPGDEVYLCVMIIDANYNYLGGELTVIAEFTPAAVEPEVMAGDANGDGEVNYFDAIMILQYYTEEEAEGIDLTAADFNGDGEINYFDAIAVLQFYVDGE